MHRCAVLHAGVERTHIIMNNTIKNLLSVLVLAAAPALAAADTLPIRDHAAAPAARPAAPVDIITDGPPVLGAVAPGARVVLRDVVIDAPSVTGAGSFGAVLITDIVSDDALAPAPRTKPARAAVTYVAAKLR